ncbi:MAG: hypothetical protein KDD46_06225 [Bdellovibrionales bacterium]|nr:hypothetical protein [Bdellovibrionales bacterium]
MKSVYIIPLTIVFLILGIVMGYLAKEVYDKQRPKEKAQSPWLSEIMAYEDDDFLHSFTGLEEYLSDTEKVLGQKLIQCIGQKKVAEQKITELEDRAEEQKEIASSSFIDRFLGKSSKESANEILPGKVVPVYGSDAVNPQPIKVIDGRYSQIFPNVSFQHPKEEEFGYYEQPVTDVDDFLDKRIAKNPDMSRVDLQRRKRSKFFQELKTAAFEGDVKVFTEGAQNTQFHGKMIFRSPSQNGQDWIVINEEGGATIETRTMTQADESVWRYNSKNPSVVLLSEQCPWNDQYVYEFKDFFFLAQENMLVANIYCKKQNASSWERVGTLKFEQIAE